MWEGGSAGNGEILVKGYKILYARRISSGELMYNNTTILNSTYCILEIC